MKTFQDLMQEHPVTVRQNDGVKKGTNDTITRWYNMYWGALTDTHMQLLSDGTYIVTSSRLCPDMWRSILYSRCLNLAPGTTLPHTWNDVMNLNKMEYSFTTHNGSFAVALKVSELNNSGELKIPMNNVIAGNSIGGSACSMGCCDSPA